MNPATGLRLLLLAAIWGSSFLFMRIAAPVLGAVPLTEGRVALAALFLWGVSRWWRHALQAHRYWRHYLLLGSIGSAIPYSLFAYAAISLPASLLAIINASAPIFAAVIEACLARRPIPARTLSGLLLGVCGVAVLVIREPGLVGPGALLAVAAAVTAALCYAITTSYAHRASTVAPMANAHGSLWAATAVLLPLTLMAPPTQVPGSTELLAVLALGVMCTGVAFILYFRLIADLGATSALTVTFLIPVFGVFWGWLFLDEAVGWHTGLGMLLVVSGTRLVTAPVARPEAP